MSTSLTAILCEEWKPILKGVLRGFGRFRMPSGVILHDVSICKDENGKAWASPASKPQVGKDGVALRRDGKIAYSPVVSFASKDLRDKFSAACIEALLAAHPDALD